MIRSITSVIIGYAIMVLVVFVTASAAWVALGADFAFREDTVQTSAGWIVVMLALGFLAALAGGWVCAKLARHPRGLPVKVLAGFVLFLGLVLAVMNVAVDTSAQRAEALAELDKPIAELGPYEAGSVAEQPNWYNFVIAVVGAAGVILGGRRARG